MHYAKPMLGIFFRSPHLHHRRLRAFLYFHILVGLIFASHVIPPPPPTLPPLQSLIVILVGDDSHASRHASHPVLELILPFDTYHIFIFASHVKPPPPPPLQSYSYLFWWGMTATPCHPSSIGINTAI